MPLRDEIVSGRRLSRLPRTSFSGLDFDNIMQDITALVTENPEYNQNWEDFLSSNAGRMMVELFAYITDQLATRIDWVVNESFIGTATQRNSVIRLLKLIGYNLSLPTAAAVPVRISLDRPVGSKLVSGNYNFSTGDIDFFSITAVDRSGNQRKNFELIDFDEQTNRYEYKNEIVIDSGNLENPRLIHDVMFHEGKTFVEERVVNESNNFSIVLQQSPVIENSIIVYRVGVNNDIELVRVQSFLDPRAQREFDTFGERNEIPYLLNVLEGDRVSVEFGPISLLPDASRRPEVNSRIRVFYRVGGGLDGNIVRRSINTTRREAGGGGVLNWNAPVNVTYVNNLPGTGGREGEDPEFAAIFGPLQIRTAQKAVTEEDYDILLSTDITIIKNKSYGNNNLPPNLRNLYGVSIRPLEVWNYVLQDKPGWRTTPPSRYNDFEWIELRLQNRFNEKHSFSNGRFNNEVSMNIGAVQNQETIEWKEDSFLDARNFVVISSLFNDSAGNSVIKDSGNFNEEFRAKFSSARLEDNFFALADRNNIFNLKKELKNNATISYNEDLECKGFCLEQFINAGLISLNNISSGLNLSVNKNLKISIDNREFLEIDASSSVIGDPADSSASDITQAINKAFLESPYYNNNDDSQTKGRQRLGFSFEDENEKPEDSSEETFLERNTTYYFRVNGIQYSFETTFEEGGPSFKELADFIRESLSFKIRANFRNQNTNITISENKESIHFIKKGMTISPVEDDDTSVLNEPLRITNVNFKNDEISLDDQENTDLRPQRTIANYEIKVYPFDVEIVDIGGNYDIEIVNPCEEPVGPVWIQEAQNIDDSQNLFYQIEQNAGIVPDSFVASSGAFGRQVLGFEVPIMQTRGFQAFSDVGQTFPISSTIRSFVLTVDNDPAVTVTRTYDPTNRDQFVVQIQEAIDDSSIGAGRVIVTLDEFNRIRITSTHLGPDSRIIIEPTETQNLLGLFIGNGVNNPIQGLDYQEMGLDEGDYSFIVNNFKYTIHIDKNETFYSDSPGEGLYNKIKDVMEPHGYLVEVLEEEWQDEIRVTFETGERVYFEDVDLFSSIEGISILNQYEIESNWNWNGFGDPIGGGDYAYVARSYEEILEDEIDERLAIFSPSTAKSSVITFEGVTEGVSNLLFSIPLSVGQIRSAYGYTRTTIIINESPESYNFGNIIYEIGSLNFWGRETRRFFYSYLFGETDSVVVGRYNTDNYDTEDPSYREPAQRIYNTYYNPGTRDVDFNSSNFIVKFTKEETNQLSIFAVEDDWDLQQSVPASLSSVVNPHEFLDTENYLITLNIDRRGSVTIDLTGDSGDAGEYSVENVIQRINFSIRENFQYSADPLYSFFNYAIFDDIQNRIIIRSPLNSDASSVLISQPPDVSVQATNAFFGLDETPGYEYEYFSQGDYYLDFNKIPFTGDFQVGSNVIRNVTGDFSKIQTGNRVLQVPEVLSSSYIVRVNEEENEIIVSNQSIDSTSGRYFEATDDLMVLHRLNDFSFPDLEFNFHFVNDRRYVEDAFDGGVIIVGEGEESEQVETLGFPLGSLDEDVYDAYLSDKKVVGVNHVFKQTRFTTFDIAGVVFYESGFSRLDIATRVEQSLRRAFSLENRDYSEIVPRSRIMNIIHQNAGVDYVQIDFLGTDYTRQETNVGNSIPARFDEILVLSENRFSGGRQVHGLLFDFRMSGA